MYILDVFMAWDYAQTIFYSEKLQIAYIKTEKVFCYVVFMILKGCFLMNEFWMI